MKNIRKQIRKILQGNEYPLEYNAENWEDFPNANCYMYALGIKIDQGFLIGDFIGKPMTHRNDRYEVIDVLRTELNRLGLCIYECDTNDLLEEDGTSFKIYLEINKNGEYHFLREDADGRWSHKAQGSAPTRRDEAGYEIVNPDFMMRNEVYGQCFMVQFKE